MIPLKLGVDDSFSTFDLFQFDLELRQERAWNLAILETLYLIDTLVNFS